MLMIWTDCDREGEHIGSEMEAVCKRAKRNIQVKRARFSAIIAQCVLSSLSSIPILSHDYLGKSIMQPNIQEIWIEDSRMPSMLDRFWT